MKSSEIKTILRDNEENYVLKLKTKLTYDWNDHDLITVYEIAFIGFFNLLKPIDLFYEKLEHIKHPDRYKGVLKAKENIERINGRSKRMLMLEIDKSKTNFREYPSQRKSTKIVNLINEYLTEPKSSIEYKKLLEKNIREAIECGLDISPKYVQLGKHTINTNDNFDVSLIDEAEELFMKFTRSSAITHNLDFDDLMCLNCFDFKRNIMYDLIPSKANITNTLIDGGCKEKNAKEIAGIFTKAYQNLRGYFSSK